MIIKNKLIKLIIFISFCSYFLVPNANAQNIGINSNGAAPNTSALLDIDASPTNNKGLLIPRVALSQTTSNAPIGAGIATSLLVYNTATVNDVLPGYYYWSGAAWVRFSTGGNDWKVIGNSNTSVSSNFFGTINNTGIAFRTNNTERMRLQSSGQLTLGATAVGAKLDVHQTTSTASGRFTVYGNINNFEFRRTQGSQVSPTSTSAANTVLSRIQAQGYNGSGFTSAAQIEFTTDATGGTSSDMPGRITFHTTPDGSGALFERMRINNFGGVRIGTTVATTLFPTVTDNTKIILDVSGGFTRIGNFNTGNNASDHPGESFAFGVGALAIGMNRTSSFSNVDFWNTTAHGQPTANLHFHRGFDWRRYDNNGNEELVMALRGDGVLTLTSNDATTEGAQIILNNAGIASPSELNSWSIDNHNSPMAPNNFRVFYNANATPAIVIPAHTSGNALVGINLTTGVTPNATLQVGGNISANSGYRTKAGAAGGYGGNVFNFNWTGSSIDAWIDVTNLGNILSDRRLKEDIKPVTSNAIDRIKKLKPVSFKYKKIDGTIFYGSDVIYEGFIADELQEVIPSAVKGNENELTTEGTIQPQSIELFPIVSVLTKAIQEQQEMIEKQQQEIDLLKKKINQIENGQD